MMSPAQERLKGQLVAALEANLRKRADRPNVPEAGVLLWRAFIDLDQTRSFGQNGPNPVSFAEIEAWARLQGYPLRPRHVAVIRAMDSALIRAFGEEVKRQQGDKKAGAKAKSAITARFFDARFAG